MEFFGRAIAVKKRKELLNFSKDTGADKCCIGFMKIKDGKFISVARFFKEDKLVSYIAL